MTETGLFESFASYVSDEDVPWVPWDPESKSEIKIYKLNPTTGEMVVAIKTPPGLTVSKHFHPGTVVVYVIQGEWTYGEGWIAKPGDVVVEAAGSTHAPTMVGQEDTIVFAVIQGSLEFVDDDGNRVGYDNWQSLLKLYHEHCEREGLEPHAVTAW